MLPSSDGICPSAILCFNPQPVPSAAFMAADRGQSVPCKDEFQEKLSSATPSCQRIVFPGRGTFRLQRNFLMNRVEIVEVGPRDGFQNLCSHLPAETKLHFLDGLIAAGVQHMQITSFVSPKAIPQMQDAAEVAQACLAKYPDMDLFALVPNLRGAQRAHELGMKKVTNVISLSASHNQANIRRTHEESFAELARMREQLPDLEISVDVATAFGCPFEGKLPLERLMKFIAKAYALGIREFTLCDTVGLANPAQVRSYVSAALAEYPDCTFQVHIHDTRNMGMVCTLAAIESGIQYVQTTLGGLGGCPFAPGASGNTATEDLVYMLSEMGYETGIDFDKLLSLAREEYSRIAGVYSGHHINIKPRA